MKLSLLLLCATLLLAACGGTASGSNSSDSPSSNAVPTGPAGLFAEKGCIACHSAVTGEDRAELGPTLVGIAARSAETIKSGDYSGEAGTVEEYIRESIIKPQVYLVPEYEPLMPQTYESTLNEEELTSLVDFVLALE
jgi:cytochrome c551/c552